MQLKRAIKCFKSENMQVTRNTILISPHRLLCQNKWSTRFFFSVVIFSHRYLDRDRINKKIKLYSWLFNGPSEHIFIQHRHQSLKIPYSFLPIDCCVRINGLPDFFISVVIFSHRYLDRDRMN